MKNGDHYHNCGVCDSAPFERNHYFYGKSLSVRDFQLEQDYFNAKRRLLNRTIHGWGIVCGLKVDPDYNGFRVERGMALTCCGDEIVVCDEQYVCMKDLAKVLGNDREVKAVLCLEADECKTEQVELPAEKCNCEEKHEFNRIRDGFRIRARRWDDVKACVKRSKVDCPHPPRVDGCKTEQLHEYLARVISEGCADCGDCKCVPLASFTVRRRSLTGDKKLTTSKEGCSPNPDDPAAQAEIEVTDVDAWTLRKYVYGNARLHGLIECYHGNFARIIRVSWREDSQVTMKGVGGDHYMSWTEFADLAHSGLKVTFDRDMNCDTINSNTFLVVVKVKDDTEWYLKPYYIDKTTIETSSKNCYTATLTFDSEFIKDEIDDVPSRIDDGIIVEIILRGSLIKDKGGQPLDGENIYLYADPHEPKTSGNGTGGGDFVDWFRVGARTK